MTKIALQGAGVLCGVMSAAISPPVLGVLVASDGRIEDVNSVVVLWSSALILVVAGLLLVVSSRSERVRNCLVPSTHWFAIGWRLRYRSVVAVASIVCLAYVSRTCYARWINDVDLLQNLEPSNTSALAIQRLSETSGESEALEKLVDTCRKRTQDVCVAPYQIWNTDAHTSAVRRLAFLEGRLGDATEIAGNISWRPGDPIPFGTSGVTRPFRLHGQTFLFDVLRDANTAALDTSSEFVKQWRRENPLWPPRNRYAWNDHAISHRIVSHMQLMSLRRVSGLTSSVEELDFLRSLIQHANRLADERHYTSGTNHGMMQNAALLAIAVNYPEFDRGRQWLQTAVARTVRYVQDSFTQEGVCLELTPYYHWVNTEIVLWFVATCQRADIAVDPIVEQRTRRAIAFCRELLQPDRSLPVIADSLGDRRSLDNWPIDELPQWPEIAELRAATDGGSLLPNAPGAHAWPSAYFIFRKGMPKWTPETGMMMVLKLSSQSRAHPHRDALSISLYANGQPILSGPGYPDYEASTDRAAILATTNQNTVSVDGKPQDLGFGTTQFCHVTKSAGSVDGSPEMVAIQARISLYPGVRHHRTLLHGPSPTGILIVDELFSVSPHTYSQNFRVADGSTVRKASNGLQIIASTSGDTLLQLDSQVVVDGNQTEAPRTTLTDGHMGSYVTSGRDVTYITRMETEAASARLQVEQGMLHWQGPCGKFEVNLPINDESDITWCSVGQEIDQSQRDSE